MRILSFDNLSPLLEADGYFVCRNESGIEIRFATGFKQSRFWGIPVEGRELPFFVMAFLRVLGGWERCYLIARTSMWLSDAHEMDEKLIRDVLFDSLGVPGNVDGFLEISKDDSHLLPPILLLRLLFCTDLDDDMFILPTGRNLFARIDHHEVIHLYCKDQNDIDFAIRHMESQGFPLPTSVPDGTFRRPSWMDGGEIENI